MSKAVLGSIRPYGLANIEIGGNGLLPTGRLQVCLGDRSIPFAGHVGDALNVGQSIMLVYVATPPGYRDSSP
jgi:hypothetical protein